MDIDTTGQTAANRLTTPPEGLPDVRARIAWYREHPDELLALLQMGGGEAETPIQVSYQVEPADTDS